jgi:hypothetical protein
LLVNLETITGVVRWARGVGGNGAGSVATITPIAGLRAGLVDAITVVRPAGVWYGGQFHPAGPGGEARAIGFVGRAGTAGPAGAPWRFQAAGRDEGSGAGVVGVTQDRAGNVYVAGTFSGVCDLDPTAGVVRRSTADPGFNWANTDVFVARLTRDGRPAWVRTFGGNSSDMAYGLDRAADGTLYLAGMTWDLVDFDPGPGRVERDGQTAFILGLDGGGRFARLQTWDGWGRPGWLAAVAVRADPAGGLVTAGSHFGDADADPTPGIHLVTGEIGSFLARWTLAVASSPV